MRARGGRGYPVYLYGSRQAVLERLGAQIETARARRRDRRRGAIQVSARVVGGEARDSRAHRFVGRSITFVGLGCPRQEIFAYEYRYALGMPVIGVGAAFDYHAGIVKEPSEAIQRLGLQWAHRLAQDPRRLWRRYLILNPAYVALLLLQLSGAWRPEPCQEPPGA